MDRVLGVDLGDARTGFALSDELGLFASALETCEGDDEAVLNRIVALTEEFALHSVVVGLPLNLDGSEGPRCRRTREFMAKLHDRLPDLKVVEWDERLSTREAEAGRRGVKRGRRDPGTDAAAAQRILQRWLNWHFENGGPSEAGWDF